MKTPPPGPQIRNEGLAPRTSTKGSAMNQSNPTLGTLTLPPIVTQTVTIPATAYTVLEDHDGPHLAVYANRTDAFPVLRIRVGAGSLTDRLETGEDLTDAARGLSSALLNAAIRGGAL